LIDLIDDILVILIFLLSFSLPFFLQGFLRFFLGSLFLILTFGHDYSPHLNSFVSNSLDTLTGKLSSNSVSVLNAGVGFVELLPGGDVEREND
jgi:hypothetical protein